MNAHLRQAGKIRASTILQASSLIVLLLPLVASSPTYAQENAEQLLQSGLYQEEVKGNLEEAIKIYERTLKDFPQDRPVAAKAQLRIGFCYEQLGEQKAQQAYERVLEEYADQPEVAVEARIRLSRLNAADAALAMSTRQVWAPAQYASAPSPDGRYLTYINWANGNLALHDLKTGENRDVTDEGTWETPQAFSDTSIWSPDSRRIAYYWIYGDKRSDLRIVGLDGSNPRVLFRGGTSTDHTPWPVAWSKDGKYILALYGKKNDTLKNTYKDYEAQIVMISVEDGSIRVLKSLGEQFTHRMSLSPDGRYVAFELEPTINSGKCDIHLLFTDGSGEVPLVDHPANDYHPFWTPDGKRIVFLSDRSGSKGLYMLDVIDGNPVGTPTMIRDTGKSFDPIGFNQDGAFYYNLVRPNIDIHVAKLDFDAGKILSDPTKVSLRFEGSNYAPVWSPDGKYLAYASRRGTERFLVIQSMESGEERDVLLNTALFVLQRKTEATPRWSPDGKSILVTAIDDTRVNKFGLYRIDVESGNITPIVRGGDPKKEGGEYVWPIWPVYSNDGQQVYFIDGPSITVHNLETHAERELYRTDTNIYRLAISPDGLRLAFLEAARALQPTVVKTISTSGGAPDELYTLKEGHRFSWGVGLSWTPDGRHVVVGGPDASDKPDELWIIPVTGGEPLKVNLGVMVDHVALHPDGRRIALTCRDPKGSSEVWVIENFSIR